MTGATTNHGEGAGAFAQSMAAALALLNDPKASDCAPLYAALYTPHRELPQLLQQVQELVRAGPLKGENAHAAGRRLEELVCAAFVGLLGHDTPKSWRSPTSQIDLYVSGSAAAWLLLCKLLRISETKRGFLIEAKAWNKKVGDQEFARLCALVDHNFESTVGCGVFFSLHGATGFPKRGGQSTTKLGDARLRQALFMAKRSVPVVVFDLEDMSKLVSPGALPRLLAEKIEDAELLVGRSPAPAVPTAVELPKHLERFAGA